MSNKKGDPDAKTEVHLTMMGKGGVGKSLVSSLLAQYFREQKRNLKAYDTDPVNLTFGNYKALGATVLDLERDGEIERRKFDVLMEDFLTAKGTTFVVDSGTSTFMPLGHYMAENHVHEVLQAEGVKLITHLVVTGGQALQDTIAGFDALAKIAMPKSVVVWVNEYFGPVELNGKTFAQMPVVANHADKLIGAVTLSKRNADTFGKDITDMVSRYKTFDETMQDSSVSIMAKQRLKMVKGDVFSQLQEIGL